MRRTLPILIGLLFVTAVSAFAIQSGPTTYPLDQAREKSQLWDDIPVRDMMGGARADTDWYGGYYISGGQYYANKLTNGKANVQWTFDRGNGPTGDPNRIDDGEGWLSVDLSANFVMYFRVIDNTLNLGAGVPAPVIHGTKSLWVGGDFTQARDLCWDCGAGYANDWCQRVESAPLAYNGTGSVTLSLVYFNKSEPCFDGTQIFLKRQDNTEQILNPYPTDPGCGGNHVWDGTGGFTDSIGSYSAPATYTRVIDQTEIGAGQNIKIVIEFTSDGGWSDQDGTYCTIWGPFGADDISIVGGGINQTYDFENGLGTWAPALCNPKGKFIGIASIGNYLILDPCGCTLTGNVMEMANVSNNTGIHPVGQHNQAESPICWFGNSFPKNIFLDTDIYTVMPSEDGVALKVGWRYFPWICPVSGVQGWSNPTGDTYFHYFGAQPRCRTWRWGGTQQDAGIPIPNNAQGVIAILEILGDCAAFSTTNCSHQTNFSPLFDNIAVGVVSSANYPVVGFDVGTRFQDVGSYPSDLFDPRAPGPANDVVDKYMDNLDKLDLCGDSLVITGPDPGNDPNRRWESRLWWRIAARAPFQSDKAGGVDTRYTQWKAQVSQGLLIDRPSRPQFTFGWMDSTESNRIPSKYKFKSNFRENTPGYQSPESNPLNEMIQDDVLFPGTRLEYFVTTNYTATPTQLFYLPDTTGGAFLEFEVLPGCRTANVPSCGGTGFNFCVYFPATLYIDAFNGGSQVYIENALRSILQDPALPPCDLPAPNGCAIPKYRNWDRYDYLDASANTNAPFARGTLLYSNNGMTISQILGYRAILLSFGGYGSGAAQDIDFNFFDQWLLSPNCSANANRQVFIANGDKAAEAMNAWPQYGLPFLTNTLGANLLCDGFNGYTTDPDCQPTEQASCVRYMPVPGGKFGTNGDVDVYSNFCPRPVYYDVYGLAGGFGNRFYEAEGGKTMNYAQVVNENLTLNGPNYRVIADGASWNHMTQRAASGNPTFCPSDLPSIVRGEIAEIGAALKWGFGPAGGSLPDFTGIPKLTSAEDLAFCQGTWQILPADVGDETSSLLVNRLYQNKPNPFNPRTEIKFSLAQTGPVQLMIYDVNGRLVRTLVNGKMDAGPHSAIWDGSNDLGHKVGSGVFWAQMKAGSFVSNKKMVILK